MVTLEQIQKSVEDLQKGTALKTEVLKLVETKMAEDEARVKAEIGGELKQARTAVEELKAQADKLTADIANLRKSRFAEIRTADGGYKGFWPNLEMCKDFGMFLMAVCGSESAKQSLKNRGLEIQYLSKDGELNTKGWGDPTIPEDFKPYLIERIGRFGVYRRNATVWPIGASSSFPIMAGDPEVYCLDAGVAPSSSTLGFGAGGLSPKKWISYIPIPRELSEDAAIAIGEVCGRRLARAFGRKEDACGFLGNGTAAYFNYVGLIPALLAVNATVSKILSLRVQGTAGAWANITSEDILALPGLIHDDADDNVDLKWFCHRNFYYTVMLRIALALNGTSATEVINTAFTANPYFLGRPVEFVSQMNRVKAAADHVPLLYGNLRQGCVLGDARQFEIATDSSVLFTSDSIAMRATERIGMNNVTGVGNSTDEDEADQEQGVIVGLYADIA